MGGSAEEATAARPVIQAGTRDEVATYAIVSAGAEGVKPRALRSSVCRRPLKRDDPPTRAGCGDHVQMGGDGAGHRVAGMHGHRYRSGAVAPGRSRAGVDRPARRPSAAVDAPQEDGARLAAHAVVMSS